MLGKTFIAISIVLGMAYEYCNINNWLVVIGIVILFIVSGVDWIEDMD